MIDKSRYEKEVLAPAADNGGTMPPDLFVRYALDASRPLDPAAFELHVADLVKLWRAFGVKSRRHRAVTDAMIAAHSELAEGGRLSWEHFASERKAHRDKTQTRLKAQITELAAGASCVSAAKVRHLVGVAGGSHTEADVAGMLAAARIRVVDPLWRLPEAPPSGRSLRSNLKTLNLELSADLVLGKNEVRRGFKVSGGFRLDGGGRITAEAIAEKKAETLAKTFDTRKSAADSVFAILEKAVRDKRIDDLVVWEITESLRESVDAQMPFKSIVGEARSLGLNPVEAEELTLSLLEQRQGASAVRDSAAEVEAALADGGLREAERLAGGLGEDQSKLRARISALSAEVAELSAAAVGALSSGRPEEAAELLARAVRLAVDDDGLAQRLAAIAPPAVTGVLAGADGGGVAVSWRPSTVRAGKVTYRVVRTERAPAPSAAAGHRVTETRGNDAVDPAPPAAVELYYTVFARRDEGSWSPPVSGPAVRCLPEVTGLSLTADEHTVRASWTAHPGMTGVEVTRQNDGRRLKAARGGFTDTDVRPGNTYRYRIQAVYETPGGKRAVTGGIESSIASETAPREVTQLTVVAENDTLAGVSWVDPGGGRVVIRTAEAPPSWNPGEALSAADVEAYGREVSGERAPAGEGRFSLTAPLGAARQYFAAVSVGGGRAIAGPVRSIRIASPVRELAVLRLTDRARLSWIWPQGATSAQVTWIPSGAEPEQPVEISQRAYHNNGGCVLTVGSAGGRVEVRALTRDADGVVESPPATAQVRGTGLRVSYEFRRRRRLFRPHRAVLRLTAETEVLVPPLDVVHATGHTQPIRRDQGRHVLRTEPQRLGPAAPFEKEFDVPKSRQSWLVCFGPDDGSVVLNRLRGNW